MKYRIITVMLLSLMISMLFMPLAVAADDSKSILKEMVQAPADYSVGSMFNPYVFWDLWGRGFLGGYDDTYDRIGVYYPDWVFWRLYLPD